MYIYVSTYLFNQNIYVSRFSTLATALEMAGMVDMFGGTASCTLFAPTNDAFDQVFRFLMHSLIL